MTLRPFEDISIHCNYNVSVNVIIILVLAGVIVVVMVGISIIVVVVIVVVTIIHVFIGYVSVFAIEQRTQIMNNIFFPIVNNVDSYTGGGIIF